MNIRNSMVRADSWQTLVVSFDRIEYSIESMKYVVVMFFCRKSFKNFIKKTFKSCVRPSLLGGGCEEN